MSSEVTQGVLVIAALMRYQILNSKKKKRTCWVRKWIKRRNALGSSNNLCLELRLEDVGEFHNMFRVSPEQFDYLLNKIGPAIQKQDTHMRTAIPARLKLEVALRFLATGDSFGTMSREFRVSRSTISLFIIDVLNAIYTALEQYIKVPNTEKDWNSIISGFASRWDFPKCIGALDGKHINIKCPPKTGSEFFNYKDRFSIVLMACVDYDYCFTFVDIGAKGRQSDGGIFNSCQLKTAIEENTLNIPNGTVIVGDEAFPLQTYLLKPYPRRNNLTNQQRIYNYRLSRCRRIVENAFGILASRFRLFERPLGLAPQSVDIVVKTACALHNWLRKSSPHTYTPPGYIDEEVIGSEGTQGAWRSSPPALAFQDIDTQNYGNNTRAAIRIRDQYCDYFNNAGAVHWQDSQILL